MGMFFIAFNDLLVEQPKVGIITCCDRGVPNPTYIPRLNQSTSTSMSPLLLKEDLKKYFYYHCYNPCGYRVRADKVNENLMSGIGMSKPNATYNSIFEGLIKNTYDNLPINPFHRSSAVNHRLKAISRRILAINLLQFVSPAINLCQRLKSQKSRFMFAPQ